MIGGWDEASNGSRRAAVWRPVPATGGWTQSLVLAGTPGNAAGYGEVNGSNGDGSILVGMADGSSTSTSGAFVLREDTGFELLGLMPSSQFPVVGGALDVTEDGRAVVGFQREGAGGFSSFRATYWSEDTGLVELRDHLESLGVELPAGFTLAAAQSISDDGRVICGWGYEDVIFFPDAWIVVLPAGECRVRRPGRDACDGATWRCSWSPGVRRWGSTSTEAARSTARTWRGSSPSGATAADRRPSRARFEHPGEDSNFRPAD